MSETPHNGADAATEKLQALIEQLSQRLAAQSDPRDQVTVQVVITGYLDNCKEEVCKANYEEKTRILGWFIKDFGPRPVITCTPLELQTWIKDHPDWLSKWTRQRINRTVQRAFNWAVSLRLIRENPFRGARTSGAFKERRGMTDQEFSALLRSSAAYFRRLITFLKFTGCRTGEASALRWCHIDWERSIAVIPEHKTVKKSGKPRVLLLVPPVMKMLAYLRRNPHIKGRWFRAAHTLHRILQDGPLTFEEVAERMKRFSFHSIKKARAIIGATYRKVGFGGVGVYELPKDSEGEDTRQFIFLNGCGRRWKNSTIGVYMRELRSRTGISDDVVLYLLRHRFISNAIKAGVNLKIVAELAGHARVATTETYTHISEDVGLLHDAAQKVNGLANGAAPTQASEAPKVESGQPATAKARPHLIPSWERTYLAYKAAIEESPELATMEEHDVFEWMAARPEHASKIPNRFTTFNRYLNRGRELHERIMNR